MLFANGRPLRKSPAARVPGHSALEASPLVARLARRTVTAGRSPMSPHNRDSPRRLGNVGSEEAPLGAGLRPPLKRPVRFSRKPLSQRCRTRVQGRNQRDQAYKPVFDDKLALRQVSPPTVAPSLVTMRPDAPHDPAVKLKEEPADMGLTIVPTPTSNDRVDLADQPLRTDWSLTTGALADLVLEVLDGFCTWKRIARSPARPASDLRGLATSEAAGPA